jgi:hypothetical protein
MHWQKQALGGYCPAAKPSILLETSLDTLALMGNALRTFAAQITANS